MQNYTDENESEELSELTREEQAMKFYSELDNNRLNKELEEYTKAIGEIKSSVNLFKSFIALEKNEDWKAFKDAYFKDEKDRLVNALTSTTPFRDETEKQLHEKITSIRHLKVFLVTKEIDSKNSEEQIKELTIFKNLIESELDFRTKNESSETKE